MSTGTPTPERVTLTAEERAIGLPLHIDGAQVGIVFSDVDVENILAAREQALREEIGARYARTGRLHEALAQSDMTPSALAETVGMPLASLHNLLYLRRLPSTTEVVAFAEVLGVDPNWLHAGDAAHIAQGDVR